MIEADEFIGYAERLGLTPAIDAQILEKVGDLLDESPHLRILVNFGAHSFHDQQLVALLERTLRCVRPFSLGIEITERTALHSRDHAAQTLARIRALGALVAIDDFGLGFNSFSELARLPCDIVKLISLDRLNEAVTAELGC